MRAVQAWLEKELWRVVGVRFDDRTYKGEGKECQRKDELTQVRSVVTAIVMEPFCDQRSKLCQFERQSCYFISLWISDSHINSIFIARFDLN